MLRGGVLDFDPDLVVADVGFLVVDERGLAGATATSCFGIVAFFRVPRGPSSLLQPARGE